MQIFDDVCNDPLPEDKITAHIHRFSTFPNEFCTNNTKTACSPGRLSRGIYDIFFSKTNLNEGRPAYVRNDWSTNDNYGNRYADYCPISLNEKEISKEGILDSNVYSYIGNCKYGKKEGFGSEDLVKVIFQIQ